MQKEITIKNFKEKLFTNTPLFLIDARSNEAFEKGHIEGPGNLSVLNIPYKEAIEYADKEDSNESIKKFISERYLKNIPLKSPVYVVCYKGNISKIMSKALIELGYDTLSLQGGMQAWSSILHTSIITLSPKLKIYQISRLLRGCLSYIIEDNGNAIIIDPINDMKIFESIISENNLKTLAIFDTHAHADHISSAKELSLLFRVPYFLHPYDAIHPMDMLPATFDFEPIKEGFVLKIKEATLKVLHIPGHTLGNIALLLNDKVLFSGDSIFIRGISRPDLGGKSKEWSKLHFTSLNKLLALNPSLLVLPGHFGETSEINADLYFGKTLKEIMESNPDLQMALKSYDEFYHFIECHTPTFPKEYVNIKRVNLGIYQGPKDDLIYLEEGKNICAVTKK
jgi:glyoxylase-like metal-dependent hydrolase (beta-lactamase superfamily II)/rhodanese-related sulfurtransferase